MESSNYSSPYTFQDWRKCMCRGVYIHKIEASSEAMWEVLSDLDLYGEILPGQSSIEVLTEGYQNLREGIRFKQSLQIHQFKRIGFNPNIKIFNTIVEVNRSDGTPGTPTSAKINCSLKEDLQDSSIIWSWEYHDFVSGDDEENSFRGSNLVVSTVLQAGGICNMISFILFGCYMQRIVLKASREMANNIERLAVQKMKDIQTKSDGKESQPAKDGIGPLSQISEEESTESTQKSRHSGKADEEISPIYLSEKNKEEEIRMQNILFRSGTLKDS